MKGKVPTLAKRAQRLGPRRPAQRDSKRRPWLWAGISGALGGVVTYLFDPQQGRRRRVIGRDRLLASVRHGTRRVRRGATRLEANMVGLGKRLTHLKPASKPDANDPTLEQRVQSAIFEHHDLPKDRVSIAVQEGVVTLRGVVDHPELIREFEKRAGKVPGVRGVENYLHLPGTPAPNKVDALEAER